MVCGQAGGFCIQPVMFLGDMITFQGEFCRDCQHKLAHATRFLVETVEGGARITPVDAGNRSLLRRVR